jgi:hypothetical protein
METNFDLFVFHGCEESVDAIYASVCRLGVEGPGAYEALGDSLLSRVPQARPSVTRDP